MNNQNYNNHEPGAVISELWKKIEANFASKPQVLGLAKELKRIESGIELQSAQVANTAAAIVLQSIKKDIENFKGFRVELVPFTDSEGCPKIVGHINFNTMYLTPATRPSIKEHSVWDEWIAIPDLPEIERDNCDCHSHHSTPYTWERIGSQSMDLSWVRVGFDKINKKIEELNCKMNKMGKLMSRAILEKAVKPLEDLRKYIHSEGYMNYLVENIPKAGINQDGIMTSNSFALLTSLAIWISNDHKVFGGGALGPDVVIELLDKVKIPTEDLKEYFDIKNKKYK